MFLNPSSERKQFLRQYLYVCRHCFCHRLFRRGIVRLKEVYKFSYHNFSIRLICSFSFNHEKVLKTREFHFLAKLGKMKKKVIKKNYSIMK